MDKKTQNFKNVNSPKIYLQIQFNSHKKIELIVNFIYKYKESRVVNKILKRRTKLEDLHDLISRLIYSLLARQFILV